MKRRAQDSPEGSPSQPKRMRRGEPAGAPEAVADASQARPIMTRFGATYLTHQRDSFLETQSEEDMDRAWNKRCGTEANAQNAIKAAVRYIVTNLPHLPSKMVAPTDIAGAVEAETSLSIPGDMLLRQARKPLRDAFSLEIMPAWSTLTEPNASHGSELLYKVKADRLWVVRPRVDLITSAAGLGARLAVGDMCGKAALEAQTLSSATRGILLFIVQCLTLAAGQALSESVLVDTLTPLLAGGVQLDGEEGQALDARALLKTYVECKYLTKSKGASDAPEAMANTGVRAALAAAGVGSEAGVGSSDKAADMYRVGPRTRMVLGVMNTLASVSSMLDAAAAVASAEGREPFVFDWGSAMSDPKRLEKALGSEGLEVVATLETANEQMRAEAEEAAAAEERAERGARRAEQAGDRRRGR